MTRKNARAKRRAFYKGCKGKFHYTTMEAANKAAIALAIKDRVAMNAYKCKHCEAFHVGHIPRSIRMKLAAKKRKLKGL